MIGLEKDSTGRAVSPRPQQNPIFIPFEKINRPGKVATVANPMSLNLAASFELAIKKHAASRSGVNRGF